MAYVYGRYGTRGNDYFGPDTYKNPNITFVNTLGLEGDDFIESGAKPDGIDGGANIDTVAYSYSNAAVTVDLQLPTQRGGYAEGDRLKAVENVVGSQFDDQITGDGGNNRLEGGRGADVLNGGNGNDTLVGGIDGSDDGLLGGIGSDTVEYTDASSNMTIKLGGDNGFIGTGVVNGGHTSMIIGGQNFFVFRPDVIEDHLFSIENVIAGSGNDTIIGNSANNQLEGGAGNDRIEGGVGFDVLFGDSGDDTLIGGSGSDTMYGGLGADTFIFRGNDIQIPTRDFIRDFEHGVDKIDLSAIDASSFAKGDQAFRIVDSRFAETGNHFSGLAGELVIVTTNFSPNVGHSYKTVMGDNDGDRVADFQIEVSSLFQALQLTASDFLF